MRTLALEGGDLVFENGMLRTVEGDAELAQSIENILATAKGEWELDEEHGLDREAILGKSLNESEATDAIIEAVTQDERIASVENIRYSFNKAIRTLSVSMTLRKQDETTLELEVDI